MTTLKEQIEDSVFYQLVLRWYEPLCLLLAGFLFRDCVREPTPPPCVEDWGFRDNGSCPEGGTVEYRQIGKEMFVVCRCYSH